MRRNILIHGSNEWTSTRAISRLFLELRPERDVLFCDPASGAGRIAYDMGERTGFKVRSAVQPGVKFDKAYQYMLISEPTMYVALPGGPWETTIVTRHRQPQHPTSPDPAQPVPDGTTE